MSSSDVRRFGWSAGDIQFSEKDDPKRLEKTVNVEGLTLDWTPISGSVYGKGKTYEIPDAPADEP